MPSADKTNQNETLKDSHLNTRNWFNSQSTFLLVSIPFLIGLLIGFFWARDSVRQICSFPRELCNLIIFETISILWGSIGIIFIFRREIPQILTLRIKGKIAVVIGVIWATFFLYVVIYPLYRYFFAN
jgi:hypothetical protein